MRKIAILAGLLLLASPALAAVTVGTQPTSLVTSPTTIGATSAPVGLFSFALTGDAAETLSSVTVTLNAASGSTVSGSDLASLSLYKDANANNTFDPSTDTLVASQTAINVGAATTITATTNNALAGGATFFVALSTGASWSGVAPADSLTATIAANGIVTSANSPTITAATTNTITATAPADTTGPVLLSAVMQSSNVSIQTSGSTTTSKSVVLTFGEATNKAAITASNINSVLALSNSHSWLDAAGQIGSAAWSVDGKILTVTLSNNPAVTVMIVPTTTLPSVAVGDSISVSGSVIKDAAGNNATGTATITGSVNGGHGDDEGDENEGHNEDGEGHACANALINGRLYKVADSTTVYLAVNCTLKPFRGEAVFHARGNKFQNIITLPSLPTNAVSTDPALPASGTLVKGSDATVWLVETGHKRKGFANAQAFLGLGFNFNQVNQIADTDLTTMPVDSTAITSATEHPDGALVKCTNSSTVLQVIGGTGTAFANEDSFTLRGHTFQQVASIDCGKFHYVIGTTVTQ